MRFKLTRTAPALDKARIFLEQGCAKGEILALSPLAFTKVVGSAHR